MLAILTTWPAPLFTQDPVASVWVAIFHSPPAWIAACALAFRWVVIPAANTHFRREFSVELKQIAAFPLAIQRLEAAEKAIEELAAIPEQLARIEQALELLIPDSKPSNHGRAR